METRSGSAAAFLRRHKRAIISLFYIAIAVFFYLYPDTFRPETAEDVRGFTASFTQLAPFVFAFLYMVRPLLFFPGILMNLAAGMLFEVPLACVCLIFGSALSAALLFFMSRSGAGKGFLEDYGGRWGGRIDRYLSDKKSAVKRMAWLRSVPLFPYDPVSLLAGASKIGFGRYISGTLIGMLPGILPYVLIGRALYFRQSALRPLALLALAYGLPTAAFFLKKEYRHFFDSGENGQ